MKLNTWLIIFVLTLGRIAYAYPNEIFERKVVLNEKDFDLNDDFPFYFEKLINAQNEKYYLGKDLTSGNYTFNNVIENELSDFLKRKCPPKEKRSHLL
jgi:hypothetical protein